jgi:hypothetical protein
MGKWRPTPTLNYRVAVVRLRDKTWYWTVTMAKRNYLVEGLSGAGKSSVYEELVRRGYTAITTDRAWAYHADPDTGLPGGPIHHDNFVWDQQKAVSELESPEPEVLFVCGSSRNRDHFLPYFTEIFNLRIDDDTMRRRLQERTDDDWPLGQEGVELMLELNRSDERPAGAIDIDATQPLNQVVDELLRLKPAPVGASMFGTGALVAGCVLCAVGA